MKRDMLSGAQSRPPPAFVMRVRARILPILGRAWDRINGYDTEKTVFGDEYRKMVSALDPSHTVGEVSGTGARPYTAIPIGAFKQMIRRVDVDRSRYDFVDIGCGKGRALILASQMGFRKVIGVELASELCQIARRNAVRLQERSPSLSPIEIVEADATLYEFPNTPLVVLLYNPFGPELLDKVIGRLAVSLNDSPRDAVLLYRWAVESQVLEAYPEFAMVDKTWAFRIYRYRRPVGG